jgi:putative CocE/NonD family hydrolase
MCPIAIESNFGVSRQSQRSFAVSRSAALLGLLLASSCGAGPAGASDVVEGEAEALRVVEPEYSAEELAALAVSAQVESNNSPFANAPAPSRSLYVTVSDGTRLALSLYFPEGFTVATSKAAVAFVESWYPRATVEATGTAIDLYLRAGFVVAIGDPRGFGASFGSQPGFLRARVRRDQAELIDWLAAQPWSNGKVAAVGFSISGTHAEAMAASGNPALKAAIVRASDFDNYTNNLFPGGIPNLGGLDFVTFLMAWMHGDACPELSQCNIAPVDGDDDFSLLRAAFKDHASNAPAAALAGLVYRDDLLGTGTVAEMSAIGHLDEARRAALPARVSASWVDGTTAEGALARFAALPRVPMEVVIGATTHSGGLNADPFARAPFLPARPSAEQQYAADAAFIQRVMAGEAIGRSVHYSVLGSDTWKTTPVWPPRGVKEQSLRFSRAELVEDARVPTGERRYRVDAESTSGAYNRWASQGGHPIYWGDRRSAPGRRLAFDAAPVRRDTELVGAPELCLALRTDQTDGIVVAYLEDVAPDGRVTYLTEGELRLLHRKTRSRGCDSAPGTERTFNRADAEPVTPGERMQIELPLLPVAALIRAGHHIRLSLAGADAGPRPSFEFSTIPGVDTLPRLTPAEATWFVGFGGRDGSTLTLPLKNWSRD